MNLTAHLKDPELRVWFGRNPPPAPPTRVILNHHEAQQMISVAERAIATLTHRMVDDFGNTLTTKHAYALRRIIVGYVYLLAGILTARVAYPLDIGCGKTKSIEALIEALWYYRETVPWTLAVAQSQVASLCELRQDLLDVHGVPFAFVGLWHSYTDLDAKLKEDLKTDPLARRLHPSDGEAIQEKQVALVTHARIGTKFSLDRLLTVLPSGGTRDLLVFDEAFYSASATTISLLDFETDVQVVKNQTLKKFGTAEFMSEEKQVAAEPFLALREFATEALALFNKQVEQLEFPSDGGIEAFALPMVEAEQRDRLLRALATVDDSYRTSGSLQAAIESSGRNATVIKANLGQYIVSFNVTISPRFERVAILDASYTIDALERRDITVQGDAQFPVKVKDYNALTVHVLKHGAGKKAVLSDFTTSGDPTTAQAAGKIAKDVAKIIQMIPETEAVLLFNFLPKKRMGKWVNTALSLRSYLTEMGVDLDATISVFNPRTQTLEPRPRICWSTWGKERGSNRYAHCANVILVGVLTRDEAEIRGALHGALRNLNADLTQQEVIDTILSQDAVVVHQAAARGTVRETHAGVCGRMRLWLFHRDPEALKLQLDQVYPGAQWTNWQTQYMKATRSKEYDAAITIRDYLLAQPVEVRSINLPEMRRVLCLLASDGLPDRTFTAARTQALGMASVITDGWHHDGARMLFRKP